MEHQAVETMGPVGLVPSLRRLFGLHDHAYDAWQPQWATPTAEGSMIRLLARNCARCDHFEFKRETVDIPAEGFPYELHLHVRIREKHE